MWPDTGFEDDREWWQWCAATLYLTFWVPPMMVWAGIVAVFVGGRPWWLGVALAVPLLPVYAALCYAVFCTGYSNPYLGDRWTSDYVPPEWEKEMR